MPLSYFFYIKSILKGKSRPHIFTWGLWAIIVFILFLLQIDEGARFGALSTLFVSILCFIVLILSYKKEKNKNIRRIDILFLILTLLAIPVWLSVKSPELSTILLLTVYSLAGEATIRKSWLDPHSEITTLWSINAIRALIAIFALSEFNFTTLAFHVLVFLSAIAMVAMLVYRRKVLSIKR